MKLFRLYDHVADKNNPTICKLSREFSETNWLNEVNQKPKLRTYILINKTLNPSEYVKSYMSKHKRSLMAQFLTGIPPLKIETGRFKKIRDTSSGKLRCLNRQERICEVQIQTNQKMKYIFNAHVPFVYCLEKHFLIKQ